MLAMKKERAPEPPGALKIVEWVRSKGSDANDLRDAAHEASHALEVKPRRWDRESIHAKIMRRPLAFKVFTELEARAVERLVCAAHGVEHDWASFEFIAFMEASKSGVWLPKDLDVHIRRLMEKDSVKARSALILACGKKESP
jgi:hypothetical protein